MTSESGSALPLTHPIKADAVKLHGSRFAVSAQGSELPRIAKELGLASVEALSAAYELTRNGERIKLEGRIQASVHQTCIVSLEPFPVELDVPLKLDFVPAIESAPVIARAEKARSEGEIDIEVRLDEEDPPEPIVDGTIDIGAVTLEFLALALDPYPRKPGVAFEGDAALAEVESPFAVLARLKGLQ